jgi:DNA-binding beta-propeller fold protein YncE
MKSRRSSRAWRAQAALLAILSAGGAAHADPMAYVVNEDSNSVSVIDVSAGATRATVSTWDGYSPNAGKAPRDVVVDPRSGRVFVAVQHRLVSFDGLRSIDRSAGQMVAGYHEVQQNDPAYDMLMTGVQNEASGLALDDAGRRIFMCHEAIGSHPWGYVHEFSILDPANPKGVKQHTINGVMDLRFIAWDAKYQRLYVVADDGTIVRASSTGLGNLSFTTLFQGSAGAPNPGGILADPAGGIWVTSRGPGKLVRIDANGTRTEYAVPGAQHPRGLAFDRSVPANLLIAVDDLDKVKRFTPATQAFADVMTTADRPQDVGVTLAGAKVSVNRHASGNGSITREGMNFSITQEKSTALAIADVPRLVPDPTSHSFCYNRTGDVAYKKFTVQNTRADRLPLTMAPIQLAGLNPGNYQIWTTSTTPNTCHAARLNWSQTCEFTVKFTASGPSNQPPSLFGGYQAAYWPAEAIVSGTDGLSSRRISLRGALYLNPCQPLPNLTLSPSTLSLGGF